MNANRNNESTYGAFCGSCMIGMIGCFAAVFGIVAIVVCGIYTYNNPDPDACWFVEGLQRPALTKDEITQIANENNI